MLQLAFSLQPPPGGRQAEILNTFNVTKGPGLMPRVIIEGPGHLEATCASVEEIRYTTS